MTTTDKVLIFDTTLRDGEQSAGIGLTFFLAAAILNLSQIVHL